MNLESITLSKSEKMLLKRNLEFPWVLLVLFVIIIILGLVFYYLAIFWGEAQILSVFSNFKTPCPEIDEYIKILIVKTRYLGLKPAIYFFSISVGMCIGLFISHFKRARLLKKLQIDTYL